MCGTTTIGVVRRQRVNNLIHAHFGDPSPFPPIDTSSLSDLRSLSPLHTLKCLAPDCEATHDFSSVSRVHFVLFPASQLYP